MNYRRHFILFFFERRYIRVVNSVAETALVYNRELTDSKAAGEILLVSGVRGGWVHRGSFGDHSVTTFALSIGCGY